MRKREFVFKVLQLFKIMTAKRFYNCEFKKNPKSTFKLSKNIYFIYYLHFLTALIMSDYTSCTISLWDEGVYNKNSQIIIYEISVLLGTALPVTKYLRGK